MSIFISKITNLIKFFTFLSAKKDSYRLIKRKTILAYRAHGLRGIINLFHYALSQSLNGDISSLTIYNYHKWFNTYYSISAERKKQILNAISNFQSHPTITILLPTYEPNHEWLKSAIESVRNQIYPNWQLCIADDASRNNETKEFLSYYETIDTRIKVKYRTKNGHISETSNTALEMAEGEFIGLLDHDDVLTADALFWVASTINKYPKAALIYSDEDKIDNKGNLLEPYFKSDWNYYLFLSQNMVSHFGVYKTSIVKTIGGFRKGFEGSQDYDLALRFAEQIDADQIMHIPRVLYHWRIHGESTASNIKSKPYAVRAAQRAVFEHFDRSQIEAQVETLPINFFQIKYKLPSELPLVCIIISSKNNSVLLKRCITSILNKTSYTNYSIMIVDNNSTEKATLDFLQSLSIYENIDIQRDSQDFNFSGINNQAAKYSHGTYLLFLNDDTEVINSTWLSEMVSLAVQENVGVVGGKLWYPNNKLQHGGIVLGLGQSDVAGHMHHNLPKGSYGYYGRAFLTQELSAVTGACMLVKKELFDEVGGFDEKNLPIAFNDVDFCLRIRENGYKVIWTPGAELYHFESKSRGKDLTPEAKARFEKEANYMKSKWEHLLKQDPFYSPNLDLRNENFRLAWPPRVENFGINEK